MAIWSTYLADHILNHVLRGTTWPTLPANVHVSLHTGDPGQTGASEVSGGSYARVAVSRATGSWDAPSDGGAYETTDNAAAITFPAPTGTWGTCSYFGVWDASTGGNFLFGGALAVNRSPVADDNAPSFAASALEIRV